MLELSIAETGLFSWTHSIIIARLLIGFELLLGLMLIVGVYRKLTWIASISTLVIFTFYLLYIVLYLPGLDDCGCMGMQIQISPLNSIYKNLILITLCIIAWMLETRYPAKWIDSIISGKWVMVSAVILSFSLPFILNPISQDRDSLLSKTPILTNNIDLENEPFLTWHSNDTLTIGEGKKLVCYFSPACRFCKMAARKIMLFLDKSPEHFPVYFVFAGNPESREKLAPFFSETMAESIPTAIIEKNKFFSVSGQSLPVIFFVNGDSIEDRDNFMTLSEDRIRTFFDLN